MTNFETLKQGSYRLRLYDGMQSIHKEKCISNLPQTLSTWSLDVKQPCHISVITVQIFVDRFCQQMNGILLTAVNILPKQLYSANKLLKYFCQAKPSLFKSSR